MNVLLAPGRLGPNVGSGVAVVTTCGLRTPDNGMFSCTTSETATCSPEGTPPVAMAKTTEPPVMPPAFADAVKGVNVAPPLPLTVPDVLLSTMFATLLPLVLTVTDVIPFATRFAVAGIAPET